MLQECYVSEIRNLIRRQMEVKGHTISSLSREIGMDKGTISRLLSESNDFNPTLNTLLKLNDALDISQSEFMAIIKRSRDA